MVPGEEWFYLTHTSKRIPKQDWEDHRSDQQLALLEQQPATEPEALEVLKRVTYRYENESRPRYKPMQLTDYDAVPPDITPSDTHTAISLLPTLERELIEMRYIEGLSISGIATKLERDYKTTHSQVQTALDKLKILLSKKMP